MSELCTVFPMPNGGVLYRGVIFSVTLRAVVTPTGIVEASFSQAQVLMDEYLDAIEAGLIQLDPRCLVQERIESEMDQRPSDERQPAQSTGDKPISRERTTSIAKQKNNKGKTVYVFGYKLSNGADPQGDIQISTPVAITMLEKALTDAGYDPTKIPAEPFPFSMDIAWTKGHEYKPGKFYRDYVEFKVLTRKKATA